MIAATNWGRIVVDGSVMVFALFVYVFIAEHLS